MTRITSSGKNTCSSNVTEGHRITRNTQICKVHQYSLRSNQNFKNGSANMTPCFMFASCWHSKDVEDLCFPCCHTEQHCYWFFIFWRTVLEHSLTLTHEGSVLSRMAPILWRSEKCTSFITSDINNTATQHNPEDLNLQDLHFLGECYDLTTETSTPTLSWWLQSAHFNISAKNHQQHIW